MRDIADLRKAHSSGIGSCWIDTSRGTDVAPTVVLLPSQSVAPSASSFEDEMQHAALLCQAARNATMSMFSEARMGNAIDGDACIALVDDIAESVTRHPTALLSLARLKSSDDYTYMHSVAVCALMLPLARALKFDEAACREAGLAGLLHDVGKAGIPIDILNKPGRLTDDEFAVVRAHPQWGHEALMRGGAVSANVLDVCLHHHEKVDGSGYPHRLRGEEISFLARMGAVCDVYDAITLNRPYKHGWDPAESIGKMMAWKGHFDTGVLPAFVQVVGIYPTGSLVRMQSERIAIVIEQNRHQLTKPLVKVFHCLKSGNALPPLTLDLRLSGNVDAIVTSEPRTRRAPALLDALWAGAAAPAAASPHLHV